MFYGVNAAPGRTSPFGTLSDEEKAELASLKETVRTSRDTHAVDNAHARIAELERRTGVTAHEVNV
jgi:hypothetical protein